MLRSGHVLRKFKLSIFVWFFRLSEKSKFYMKSETDIYANSHMTWTQHLSITVSFWWIDPLTDLPKYWWDHQTTKTWSNIPQVTNVTSEEKKTEFDKFRFIYKSKTWVLMWLFTRQGGSNERRYTGALWEM